MHPHFNPNQYNPNSNQLPLNGTSNPSIQQVLGNPGNFLPNTPQINPQFQVGLPSNPQLVAPPFGNPNNAFVNANQLLPLLQSLGAGNLPQLLAHNAMNQFNGQLNVPNLAQNLNSLLGMQMANFGFPNAGPFMNAQPGLPNVGGFAQQGPNIAVPKDSNSFRVLPNQSNVFPGAVNMQNNAAVVSGPHDTKANWRNPHSKNFTVNRKHDTSRTGFNKKQFHNRQGASGSFRTNDASQWQGNKQTGMKNFNSSTEKVQVQNKRSLPMNYTQKEIQEWREERRKNYPSAANVEKKLKRDPTQLDDTDAVAKAKRQQLKEILAKQAELGFEVPEIPSHYLSDSEQQTNVKHQNSKVLGKRGRFQNKFDNRKGKFHKNDRFVPRQRFQNDDSSQNQRDQFASDRNISNKSAKNVKREPSLLEKLLSKEIRREKKHLLQVFRFMVMNSFFDSGLEKPLKYPVVIVKEQGSQGNYTVEEKTRDAVSDEQIITNEKVPCAGQFDDDFNLGKADNWDSKSMIGCSSNVEEAITTTDEEDESSEDGEITD